MILRITSKFVTLAGIGVLLLGAGNVCHGQEASTPTYEADVRPLFKKHCTACHNQKKAGDAEVSGGLALDSYAAIEKARSRKPAIFAGVNRSHLIERLTANDETQRMPQGGEPLAASEIGLIRRWLEGDLKQGEPISGQFRCYRACREPAFEVADHELPSSQEFHGRTQSAASGQSAPRGHRTDHSTRLLAGWQNPRCGELQTGCVLESCPGATEQDPAGFSRGGS